MIYKLGLFLNMNELKRRQGCQQFYESPFLGPRCQTNNPIVFSEGYCIRKLGLEAQDVRETTLNRLVDMSVITLGKDRIVTDLLFHCQTF